MATSRIFLCGIALILTPSILTGCALRQPQPEGKTEVHVENEATDLAKAQEHITQLQNRIQDLETRLTAMNEKINLKLSPEPDAKPVPETKIIQPHPATVKAAPVPMIKSSAKSDEAIIQDDAADRYREAKILFDSSRFSDSILEFTDFIKTFPHHAFAPASQYYLGLAYYKQKEYKIAEEEWSRGLISYPHSQFTADTLRGLMNVSDQLKKPEKVAYFEQKLMMLFPNSPQAKGLVAHNSVLEERRYEEPEGAAAPYHPPTKPVAPTEPELPRVEPSVEGDSHP